MNNLDLNNNYLNDNEIKLRLHLLKKELKKTLTLVLRSKKRRNALLIASISTFMSLSPLANVNADEINVNNQSKSMSYVSPKSQLQEMLALIQNIKQIAPMKVLSSNTMNEINNLFNAINKFSTENKNLEALDMVKTEQLINLKKQADALKAKVSVSIDKQKVDKKLVQNGVNLLKNKITSQTQDLKALAADFIKSGIDPKASGKVIADDIKQMQQHLDGLQKDNLPKIESTLKNTKSKQTDYINCMVAITTIYEQLDANSNRINNDNNNLIDIYYKAYPNSGKLIKEISVNIASLNQALSVHKTEVNKLSDKLKSLTDTQVVESLTKQINGIKQKLTQIETDNSNALKYINQNKFIKNVADKVHENTLTQLSSKVKSNTDVLNTLSPTYVYIQSKIDESKAKQIVIPDFEDGPGVITVTEPVREVKLIVTEEKLNGVAGPDAEKLSKELGVPVVNIPDMVIPYEDREAKDELLKANKNLETRINNIKVTCNNIISSLNTTGKIKTNDGKEVEKQVIKIQLEVNDITTNDLVTLNNMTNVPDPRKDWDNYKKIIDLGSSIYSRLDKIYSELDGLQQKIK